MATRLATATVTTTRLAGASGPPHRPEAVDPVLADSHVLADGRPTRIRRHTYLGHDLVKTTRPQQQEQNKLNVLFLRLRPQARRQALRPQRALRAFPANEQTNQETKLPSGVPIKSNESDGHFGTRGLERPRPTGHRSTWVLLFALFAEEAKQQEGAS